MGSNNQKSYPSSITSYWPSYRNNKNGEKVEENLMSAATLSSFDINNNKRSLASQI